MNTQARPPMAVAARNASASACMLMDSSRRLGDFGGVERGRKPLLFAEISRALPEPRTSDPGRAMPPDDLAVRVFADHVVHDDVDRGADHLADGARGQREAAHRDHGFAA